MACWRQSGPNILARMEPQVYGFQELGWKRAITPNSNTQDLGLNPGWDSAKMPFESAAQRTVIYGEIPHHEIRIYLGRIISVAVVQQEEGCFTKLKVWIIQYTFYLSQLSSKTFNIILEDKLPKHPWSFFQEKCIYERKKKKKIKQLLCCLYDCRRKCCPE